MALVQGCLSENKRKKFLLVGRSHSHRPVGPVATCRQAKGAVCWDPTTLLTRSLEGHQGGLVAASLISAITTPSLPWQNQAAHPRDQAGGRS